MNKTTANLLCLLVAVIWGGGFITASVAIETIPPAVQLMLRFSIGALPALGLALIGKRRWSKAAVKTGILSGVLVYAAFLLQTIGLKLTETGMNAFLTAVNVVLVPWFSWLIYKKRPQARQFAASVVSIAGIGMLCLSTGSFQFRPGDFFSLMCAVFFALQIAVLGKVENEDPWVVNGVQMVTAAVCSIPYALCVPWPKQISAESWGCILYSGLLATFLCYLLQTIAQKYTSPSSAGVLLSTESLWANVLGFLILHETKTPVMILGGLLIFVSILLAEGPSMQSLREAKARS